MSEDETAKKSQAGAEAGGGGGGGGGGSKKEAVIGTALTPKQRELYDELKKINSKVDELRAASDLQGAIALLTKFEKKTRLLLEYEICADAVVLLVKLYQEAGDFKALNTAVLTISKHRQQHRKVIAAMMKECMSFLDTVKFPDNKDYLDYIQTLRTVSEGKIYLEVDSARLTMRVAKHKEAEGDLEEASRVLQEVAVETYGTMNKFEKAEFLLEQVRLCLVNKDFVRASIVANKVDRKVIRADDFQAIKLKYYDLMVQFYLQKNSTLQLCDCYLEVLNTPSVQVSQTEQTEDGWTDGWMRCLQAMLLCARFRRIVDGCMRCLQIVLFGVLCFRLRDFQLVAGRGHRGSAISRGTRRGHPCGQSRAAFSHGPHECFPSSLPYAHTT
jgi:hypothetical protein